MSIDFKKYPFKHKIRHHVGSNLYFPYDELVVKPNYYPPLYKGLDIRSLFLNGKFPNVLDIGCGKGKFLFEYSMQNPEKNILGMEVRKTCVDWIKEVIEGEKTLNSAVMWYSVVNGLDFIPENSIEHAFYLFPDPWPKKRQENRRLFSVTFLKEIQKVLKSDGCLWLATDCDYVDMHHRRTLAESVLFEYREPTEQEWSFPVTNKETFCQKKDIPVFRLVCIPKK